ncbi:alpha/beta fold hydrolase [Altererythrobacter sp. ZODW24]|uniref:alpha/beta fold hydrolase n=1 Tax=Altererythrobacter sp. ZODW24 TaxID=2185142 RepID=UPI000DF75925|nr:alpha/beta fold hydrolase [Altererythrobacter sp. ZODW24]
MPQITANNIAIEYEEYGDAANPPMLLVMGLGAQLTLWPMELVEALVERGYRVIRYDNRDIGLSQKIDDAGNVSIPWTMIKARFGFKPKVPYTLSDMAADAVGLLDALDIEKAHIVGASMGGMISQLIAAEHPDRVLSLTSVMSTTGHRKLPAAKREAFKALTTRPADMEMETIREHGLFISRAIGSPGYPGDETRIKDRTEENFNRSYYPAGMARQLAAIIADGDRRTRLSAVTAPTLVVHGEADPLVTVEGGHDTAKHIPGAKLKTFPGMGHDLPLELVDPMADAIAEHAAAA